MRISTGLLTALLCLSPTAFGGVITWKVENGFPLFKDPKVFEAIRDEWKPEDSPSQFLAKQNAETLRELLPVSDKTLWDSAKGTYDKKLLKDTHTIIATINGASPDAACEWKLNSDEPLVQACDKPFIKNNVKEQQAFSLSVLSSDGLSETIEDKVTSRFILGFGDSFASGEGNPDHAAVGSVAATQDITRKTNLLAGTTAQRYFKTSAKWLDTACHRSLLSWQSMYAMHEAVKDPHRVVKFASFSCSGAEAYDGFFRAQTNPPGMDSPRVQAWSKRDGGNYLVDKKVGKEVKRVEATIKGEALNLSQLNAAIMLTCTSKISKTPKVFKTRNQVETLSTKRYYGAVNVNHCLGEQIKPDEVLLAFGGNDFGFAKVVAWGVIPQEIHKTNASKSDNPLAKTWGELGNRKKEGALWLFRKAASTLHPETAGAVAQQHMENLYSDMNLALTQYMKIEPEKVNALIYPDPLQMPLQRLCPVRMNEGNLAIGAILVGVANKVPGFTTAQAARFEYAINPKKGAAIKDQFIDPLMSAQKSAIGNLRWAAIDPDPSFKGRSLCAVSSACEEGNCPQPELSAWEEKSNYADASLAPIKNFAEWEPYAYERTRSLRTSNDAMMTQSRFDKDGKLRDDWVTGSMHPDAFVHASIADSLSRQSGELVSAND